MSGALRRLRLSRRGRKQRGRGKALLAFAAAVLAGGVSFSEWGLGSISEELTQEAVRGYVLSCVNQSVAQALEGDPAFVTVERDSAGTPLAVHTDAAALNALRVQVLERLEETLNGSVTVEVPAGSLTGIALLNGRGFSVPFSVNLEAAADLSCQTEIVSAGINQSCHRVTMTVAVQAYSQSQRFQTQAQVETSTVLAETVLVGEVPEMALLENQ